VSDDIEKETFRFRGAHRTVYPPEELVFTRDWKSLPIDGMDGPGNALVTVKFIEQSGMTTFVLTQEHLPNRASRDAHNKGGQGASMELRNYCLSSR
jgi:uncharacterized protein YndB with AHSA1/START domain